ncbi:MAG: molybdopterin-guanine dinucleotide biosynthesis protein B [Slackia sp.]|nr:molybdopterin-guanine dinucleotide biosynthesis protein B [Slackia sp.]
MRMVHRPSPAVSFVGRHNSGKTTLLVKVIAALVSRGLNIGTVKHHGHPDFDIDYPGKDSFRHREAGSCDTVIVSPTRMARVTALTQEPSCDEVVASMPDHDLVIVEGYRQSGLPVIEVIRWANERDRAAAEEFCETGSVRGAVPCAVVTDVESVANAASARGMRAFSLEDIEGIADYLVNTFARPAVTVAIQAGGESRRMGQSKATVPFLEKPLLARIISRVAPAADELIVTTNEPERLGFVDELDLQCPVRLVTDAYEERGALKGMATAFEAARNPVVAIVACDMIFASASLIVEEARMLHEGGFDAVVPYNKFGYEPFHAVYRKDACLAASRIAIDQGKVRARDFFESINLGLFQRDDLRRAVPEGGCFINANTPDELARIEKSIEEDGDR